MPKFLAAAKKEANKSKVRAKHGCVLAKSGRVIGRGHNSYKTHPKFGGGPLRTVHAEASAIRDAIRRGIDLKGAIIYVARLGQNPLSRPCSACRRMIERYGIYKVVHS